MMVMPLPIRVLVRIRIDKIPSIFFLIATEFCDFVMTDFFTLELVGRRKFNHTFCITGLALLGVHDLKPKPFRLRRPLSSAGFIEVFSLLRSEGAFNIADIRLSIGDIPGSHKGFGRRRILLARQVGMTAVPELETTSTNTRFIGSNCCRHEPEAR